MILLLKKNQTAIFKNQKAKYPSIQKLLFVQIKPFVSLNSMALLEVRYRTEGIMEQSLVKIR
jgi:hypothetical protein